MFRHVLFFVFSCAAIAAHGAPASTRLLPVEKGPDPNYAPSRVVFDCSGQDTLSIGPGYTAVFARSTATGPADFDTYPCKEWNEYGPEHVYRLEVTGDVEFTATLLTQGDDSTDVDLDLFLLGGCDTDVTVACGDVGVTVDLAPDTYFLVVDTHSGTSREFVEGGPYELEIAARWPGVPPAPCSGGSELIACFSDTLDGDLHGLPDLVRTYDCNPGISRGGEAWYEITSPALRLMNLEVEALSEGLDPVLWLFDGCGPDAVCLGFVNDTLAWTGDDDGSGREVLQWPQESDLPATVWLAVDCTLPPLAAGGGDYRVVIDCQTVPRQKTSAGGLRALYR